MTRKQTEWHKWIESIKRDHETGGYHITLECGHDVWAPLWPPMPQLYCAACVHAMLDAARSSGN